MIVRSLVVKSTAAGLFIAALAILAQAQQRSRFERDTLATILADAAAKGVDSTATGANRERSPPRR